MGAGRRGDMFFLLKVKTALVYFRYRLALVYRLLQGSVRVTLWFTLGVNLG